MVEHSDKNRMMRSLFTYTQSMIKKIKERPAIATIYFHNYGNQNVIGETIREVENKYLNILSQNIANSFQLSPNKARIKAEMIHYMRMGAVMLHCSRQLLDENGTWEEEFWQEFYDHLQKTLLG